MQTRLNTIKPKVQMSLFRSTFQSHKGMFHSLVYIHSYSPFH